MLSMYVSYANAKARLASSIKSFLSNQSGVTAIEYGLIAGLVGVAIIAGATTLGGDLGTAFSNIGGKIAAAVP